VVLQAGLWQPFGMRTLPQAFGAAVRRLREKAGHSQEGFAQRAEISRTYMSEIERGVTNVSLETVDRLASALETTMSNLLREAEIERRLRSACPSSARSS